MPSHLLYNDWAGAQEQAGALPERDLMPVALAADGRVVYGRSQPRRLRPGLVAYTPDLKKLRRELAETVLGYYALKNSTIIQPTLDRVSAGILAYWQDRRAQLERSVGSTMVTASDKY